MKQPVHLYNTLLTQRFQQGDPAVFAAIYHKHQPAIYYFALKFLNNATEAEDVAAEIFVKLWRMREQFNNIELIGGWLRLTTRNACLDILKHRKLKAGKTNELLVVMETAVENFTTEDIKAELLKQIYEEVENLPKKSRQVFKLRYLEGLKNEEIAQQLGINNQSVRDHLARSLKILRMALFGKNWVLPVLLFLLGNNDQL